MLFSSLCKSEKFIFSRRGFKPYFERIERQKPRKIVLWRAEKRFIKAYNYSNCRTVLFCTATGAAQAQTAQLYLGGFPAGFVLNTTTVEVVGMCDVMTESGLQSPARDGGLKTGDVIKSINGEEVTSAEEVTELLSKDIRRAEIKVLRDGEEVSLTVIPVKDVTTGKPRVGVLVRDSLSGVGTVTYINGTDGTFASLGHPVTDTAGNTTKINGGTLYGCIIYDVKRGVRGNPGELKGAFQNSKSIGVAALNCDCGVFGDLEKITIAVRLPPCRRAR